MSIKDCCDRTAGTRRDIVGELFEEAMSEVDEAARNNARLRIKSLLLQKQKTQQALAEIDRQLADLRIELKETL